MYLLIYKDVVLVLVLVWEKNVFIVSKILIYKVLKKIDFWIFERFLSVKKIIM